MLDFSYPRSSFEFTSQPIRKYTVEGLEKAVNGIINGTLKWSDAKNIFNIPSTTLHRHLKLRRQQLAQIAENSEKF